jgi:hypothetical protein
MSLSDDERKNLALNAHMEGQQVILKSIGTQVKVSQMELICLVNFAEVGLMSLYSALDGEVGEQAEAELEKHLNAIRKVFSGKGGTVDGLNRLSCSTAALLRSPRFRKYLTRGDE